MPYEDFDSESLAAYLHITPSQVTRLADRGKIPARKVGGDWKFSQAEIHHWLEERIGLSGGEELEEMEGVFKKNAPPEQESLSVAELLPPEAVAFPLPARTRNSVFAAMCELASGTGLLWEPDKMAEAVRERENLHPTALDNGVALLHPRRPQASILGGPLLALGRTHQGIPFGGGALTDIFFLICSTDDRVHLRTLARLSRLIADPKCLDSLRAAGDSAELHAAVVTCEENLYTNQS